MNKTSSLIFKMFNRDSHNVYNYNNIGTDEVIKKIEDLMAYIDKQFATKEEIRGAFAAQQKEIAELVDKFICSATFNIQDAVNRGYAGTKENIQQLIQANFEKLSADNADFKAIVNELLKCNSQNSLHERLEDFNKDFDCKIEKLSGQLEALSKQLDSKFAEYSTDSQKLNNLHKRLKDLTGFSHKGIYLNSEDILHCCTAILNIDAEDDWANFVSLATKESNLGRNVNGFLSEKGQNSDFFCRENLEFIRFIIYYLMRTGEASVLENLNRFLDKCQSLLAPNEYNEYLSETETLIRRLNGGEYYNPYIDRDVFVIYDNDNIDVVHNLVKDLEDGKLKCYYAARNLRNGRNAAANYETEIKNAITHCSCTLLVSTKESRKNLNTQKERAWSQNLNPGAPHFELLVEQYDKTYSTEDRLWQEYFGGNHRYNKDEVDALIKAIHEGIFDYKKSSAAAVKYCKHCGTQLDKTAVCCWKCKKEDFVATYEEYARIKAAEEYEDKLRDYGGKIKDTEEKNKELQQENTELKQRLSKANEKKEVTVVDFSKPQDIPAVPDDAPKKVKRYYKKAEKGDARARNILGDCYYFGYGVEQSYSNAVYWYHKAAEQEYAEAQFNLGTCFFDGMGVKQSDSDARYWHEKAAKNHHPGALNNLAFLYKYGRGVEQDEEKAFNLYKAAARYGDELGCSNLAACYRNGTGTEVNEKQAKKWDRRYNALVIAEKVAYWALIVSAVAVVAVWALFFVAGTDVVISSPEGISLLSFLSLFCLSAIIYITMFIRYWHFNGGGIFSKPDIICFAVWVVAFVVTIVDASLINFHKDTIEYTVTDDGVLKCTYIDDSVTDVVIPAQYDGIEVTSIGFYAFYNYSSLTSITIPDGVTSIGESAFSGCSSLTSITIPDSVTDIGAYAFYNCSSLTGITIPDNVTGIGDYAFYGCNSLTSIVIPDKTTYVGIYAFDKCDSLNSVYYGGDDSEWNRVSIFWYGNYDLKSATIYYYSETQPVEEGNFWHYADGVPQAW